MDIISIDNLTQVFSSGHQSNIVLLNNLSLKFTNMSLVAITGKSGCGKSTLLNCLYGLLKPTKGRISFLGNDIYKMKEKGRDNYRNKYISMVFQHYNLFDDFTSIENVILPLLIKGIKKNKATKKAKELFIKYKIEHLINKKIKNLSGGEKQRIAILRSLIQDPLVLLCDEPTGALDEENSLMVMNILKEISKQKLVIFVSHNEKLVSLYADRIISLKNGKIERDVVNKTLIDKQNITEKYHISKIKNERLSKMFVKKNIRKDKGKNILSLLTSSFGFSMVILSYGFNVSTNINKDKLIFKNADVFNATLSTKHYVEIPNYSLLLEKSSSPNNDEINYFKSYCHDAIVKQNYDYFFPNYCSLSVDKKIITNFEFIPLYNNSLIGESIFKSISDVIINSKAKELINNSKNLIVFNEKEIKNIDNDGNIIKDNFSFSFKLNVKDSIEEFSFLNTPKIYYSYKLFEDYISEFKLENLSSVYNEDIFLIDYINTSNDDSINNYSKRIFFENIESVNKAKEFKNKNIVLESKALEINNTYIAYVDSFSKAFTYFSIISFVMLNLIIGIISISTYIENKRENAILRSLGYSLNNILKIYVKSNALIVFNWPISFFRDKLGTSSFNLIPNQIVFEFDDNFDVNSLIKRMEKMFVNYDFINPSNSIAESVDETMSFANIALTVFSVLSSFISFLLLAMIVMLNIIENKSEINLFVSFGLNHKNIKKLYITETLINGVIGFALASFEMIAFDIVLSLTINNLLKSNGQIVINLAPIFIVFLITIFSCYLISFVVSSVLIKRK